MALFASTPCAADKVSEKTFEGRALQQGEFSLARRGCITRKVFHTEVIARGEPHFGTLKGLSRAQVSTIRAITYQTPGSKPPVQNRAICVLDRVTQLDHSAHAVLRYAESMDRLSQKWRGAIRANIRLDLATVFGAIVSFDNVFPPSFWQILTAKFRAIFRNLLGQ